MATVYISSNEGQLPSASAVMEVVAINLENIQPALRIPQASEFGGVASLRIDDPNPDTEFVETHRMEIDPGNHGAGKYEIAVQSDRLQINGRKADGEAFETFVVFDRLGLAGISVLGQKTSSVDDAESLQSQMLALSHRRIPPMVGSCMASKEH